MAKMFTHRQIVNKILSSSYLKSVYFYALENEFFQQKDVLKDMKEKTPIKYPEHLSKTIKDLTNLGLVECVNPENFNYKRYKTTKKAHQVKEEVEKYGK